jgi:monoamine oxidase
MQVPESIGYEKGENCAMVRIRPGGQDYAVAALGGRFAWWMEKQGEDAACQWFRDILADLFGNDAVSGLGRGKVSAWGFDPWTRGAYSARIPGAGDVRGKLAAPVDDRLWFAGEAASHNQFCTAHGAWINGRDAVSRMFECGGGEFPMDQDIRTGAGARA